MIILGVLLLILGWIFHVSIFTTLGVIAVVIGVVLAILQLAGHGLGNRYWY